MTPKPQTTAAEGWVLVPDGEPVTLAECPVGLFTYSDGSYLGMKSEYGNNEGRIDAFIVESGEFLWGPAPQTIARQRAIIVQPLAVAPPPPPSAQSLERDVGDEPSHAVFHEGPSTAAGHWMAWATASLQWARDEIVGLCEATEDDPTLAALIDRDDKMGAFARGRIHEAKGIRNAMAEVIRARLSELPQAGSAPPHPTPSELIEESASLTKALTGLTCGGSEFFIRKGERFVADIDACVEWVRRRDTSAHDLWVKAATENRALIERLNKLADEWDKIATEKETQRIPNFHVASAYRDAARRVRSVGRGE